MSVLAGKNNANIMNELIEIKKSLENMILLYIKLFLTICRSRTYGLGSIGERKRSPLEDPVKNAVCSRNVRPQRGR